MGMHEMLYLTDIHKTYVVGPAPVQILCGIDLKVNPGDLVSIMGSSGSGKSTLMNIIGLLDSPSSGSYMLDGREVLAMSDDQRSAIRNASIGFVFQSFYLLPRLTALENVGIPLVYRGMKNTEIRLRAAEALDRVGMGDCIEHRPNQLSGGQQQRVAIARALAGKPAIVLADEPTGALDQSTGNDIMDLFVRLNREEGTTIIVITHDAEIARRCVRRTRIEEGLLHEEGIPCS
ncbi:MAG: ABC transporter ATP-binding protein [Gammaproteobacteria bacterium]|nr:ABC transporter ATP-binding protein [Gammaproteobacteria bacterium]